MNEEESILQVFEYAEPYYLGDYSNTDISKFIRKVLQERNNYKELYEKEKEKVEMYENPDDLTLFYMWLDTKAKDKMKRLTNNWNELKKWFKEEIKYDENWYNPECEEYIGPKKYPDDTIDGFKYSLDKMQEIERL